MRKTVTAIAMLVFVMGSVMDLSAQSMAGVTLPGSVQAAGRTLVLNGMGLRTKMMVKVYVAGLYLEQKSSDANAIVKAEERKRLVMHFIRDVSQKQMADAFRESFEKNTPDLATKLKPDVDKLMNALTDVKSGQEMAFTYVPGAGTTMSIAGQDKLTIAGPEFGQMMFSVWLGPKPPNENLKKGLIGQA